MATLGLTNCMQGDTLPATMRSKSIPFEIYLPDSRTENNGDYTLWSEGDNLSVFYAESGTETFNGNREFVLADVATGRFVGSLAGSLTAESYDWYVTYPYCEGFTALGVGDYNTIGCAKSVGYQIQNGNNSSAHLCGTTMPLVGAVKGVNVEEPPVVTMRNVASFALFTITNRYDEPISITSIAIKAEGCHLAGDFSVAFDEKSISCTPREGYTLDTATLQIANGETINVGDSAEFYLSVAPFVLTESREVAFTVTAKGATGEELVCTKSATFDAGWGFTAGRYKRVNFGFEASEEAEESITLTQADITNIDAEWGYADTDIKEIRSAEGHTWYAYRSSRTSIGQTTVNLKAASNIGYLATPVVEGSITRVAITLMGSTKNARFAIYGTDVIDSDNLLYASEALGVGNYNIETEYMVELSSNVSQLYIRSDNVTIKICSVTVYYE